MSNSLILSSLNKTWIFDLDGTLVKHNGYKIDGEDTLLEGVREFFYNLNPKDMVIIITARSSEYKEQTIAFLNEHSIRYNHIIFDAPMGERIIFNDKKLSGMETAYSINLNRNEFYKSSIVIDEKK